MVLNKLLYSCDNEALCSYRHAHRSTRHEVFDRYASHMNLGLASDPVSDKTVYFDLECWKVRNLRHDR